MGDDDDSTRGRTPGNVELGRRIVQHRKRAGLSQQALAAAMRDAGQTHWRQTTASRVENGIQPLTVAEMAAIQRILGFEHHSGVGTISLSGTVSASSDATGTLTTSPGAATAAGGTAEHGTIRKLRDAESALHGTIRRLQAAESALRRALGIIHELRDIHGDPPDTDGGQQQ